MIFLFIVSFPLIGQDKRTYKHPQLDIQVEAPSGWKIVQRPEDRMIYEIADPEKSVHVMVWCPQQDFSRHHRLMKDILYSVKIEYKTLSKHFHPVDLGWDILSV